MQRRALIAVTDNTEQRHDYLSMIVEDIEIPGVNTVNVVLRYVPDRFVLEVSSWHRYLTAVGSEGPATLEAFAADLLSDASDVIIARWIEIAVTVAGSEGSRQIVVINDRQPGWDNQPFLDRLVRLGDVPT